MGVISLTVLAGFRNAFKTRLYEMPAHLYLLTWVPNLVLQTLFFTYLSLFAGGAPSRQWAILGSVMRLAALPTCIQTTYHLVADREEGNLSYLSTTPASLGLLWLGRSLYFSVEAVVTVLLISLLVFPFAGMGGCLETWFLYVVPVAASCFSRTAGGQPGFPDDLRHGSHIPGHSGFAHYERSPHSYREPSFGPKPRFTLRAPGKRAAGRPRPRRSRKSRMASYPGRSRCGNCVLVCRNRGSEKLNPSG